MKKLFCLLTMMTIILLAGSLAAQEVVVSGLVVDAQTREPLSFANVSVRGTRAGAATRQDGSFSFRFALTEEATLVATYMGYESAELVLRPGAQTTDLLFELRQDIFEGETVIVTGVASERSRSRSEVAVARVNAENLTQLQSYTDVSSLLGGKVAGVQVRKASGNVGGGIRFDMRANPGLGGDGQPLVVIDGVQINSSAVVGWGVGGQDNSMLADLNPDEIASIDILKGPAATASYGTNGSNGVVLITTKRGQGRGTGEATFSPFRINYKSVFGLNTPSYTYKESDFPSAPDANDVHQEGAVTQHVLDVSGGSPTMRYYVGIDRREEEGIIPNNDFSRTSLRANIDVFPSEKMSLQASTSYIRSYTNRPNNDNNIIGFLGNTMLLPVSWRFHPEESVRGLQASMLRNRFIGSVQLNYSPFKNFRITGSVGLDENDLRDDQHYPYGLFYSFLGYVGEKNLWTRNSRQINGQYNMSYSFTPFQDMEITSSVGGTFYEIMTTGITFSKKEFETGLITNIGAAGLLTGGNDTKLHSRNASILTTHQFAFKDQYFATVVLRNEYASTIGVDAPEIFYPNATLAVRLDKYDFFPKAFDLFKFRTAYGESGQLPGNRDAQVLLWRAERSGHGTGAAVGFIGNPEIEPERIKEFEIGFDAEFLTNYAVEFTYFIQNAENSIIGRELAPSTGLIASNVPYNVGKAKGWGWEAMFRGRPINTRNFSFDFTLTHSFQDNEVVDIGEAQPMFSGFDVNVIKPGLPKWAFYVPEVFGARFNDAGEYAGVDTGDRIFVGSPVPNHTGSLNLNFRIFSDLNIRVLGDWTIGMYTLNMTRSFQALFGNHTQRNDLAAQLGELTPGTDEYIETAHAYARTDGNWDYNFVEESDFFKLREISLSYDLSRLMRKLTGAESVNSLVLGLSGINLWTTTKYSGADPEVNSFGSTGLSRANDFLTVMHPRSYEMWLRIGL